MTAEAATPEAPATRTPTWLDRFFWNAWVPMAWLLPPALLSLFWTVGGGGWDALILVVVSPVALPVYALLNLLPRRILRKRHGFDAGSMPLTVLLALHWWGLICTILFWRGTGDSGTIRSMVGSAYWWMPRELETVLSSSGLWLWLLSAAGLLIYALIQDGRTTPQTPRGPQGFAARWVGPILAIALPPLVVVLAISLVYGAGNDRTTDASGRTEKQALSLDEDGAREAMSANWDALQEQIVPLRTELAADGWKIMMRASRGNSLITTGIGIGTELESNRDPIPGYVLATSWMVPLDGAGEADRARIKAATAAQGWQLTDTLEGHVLDDEALPSWIQWQYTDEQGHEYLIEVMPAVDESMDPALTPSGAHATITAISPEYWREGGLRLDWEESASADESSQMKEKRFSSREWPELRLVESASYYGW